jgi:peroxiredoxin
MPVYTPEKPQFNTLCPDFLLPATDGRSYQKKDFLNQKPLVIMFICNHCPYVKAIEDRLITLGHDLKKLDINVVAICSNDDQSYPEDSFANLKARAELKQYPFPYLHDKNQDVAKAFGAICTPDYFVYDQHNRLAYRGRLDDSWKEATLVKNRELYNAVLKLNQGHSISPAQTPSMGCSIKWVKTGLEA